MGKNSKLNRNKMQDTLQKQSIKKSIENIGFFDKITKIADIMHVPENMLNKSRLIVFIFYLSIFYRI